jgi:heavy metal sensor kinase
MKQLPRSITGKLLFWLLCCTTVILTAVGMFLYYEVEEIIVSSVDRSLHSTLQILTGLLHEDHGKVELELSEIIPGEYITPHSGHYYKVMMDNAVLAASPSLADDNFVFIDTAADRPGDSFFTSRGPAGKSTRVLRYQVETLGKKFVFTVAESLDNSLEMIATFQRFLLIAITLGIALLCLTAWWITRVSLQPLATLSTTIETITHKNLTERIDTGMMARELSRLAHSFNAMLARIHNVFESQKRLVADASHELKTPVAVIKTQCDVILQRARTPDEYVDALQTVQESARSMTILINNLLSLARLDAPSLSNTKFVPVSLSDSLEQGMRMTRQLARERNVHITVSVDESLIVMSSRTGLDEALLNLIENGIRYNRQGGTVAITAMKQASMCVITVTDTGIGIKESDLDHVFERFFRADDVRGTEGTGLGLSIVKSIIDAHEGKIAVESEPGKGTRITVVLPLAVQDATSG